ncbi:MAG: TonB-dependent receptor [Ahniella sp.]|nr:TonB-dependent receptor [Ahniella sp.]
MRTLRLPHAIRAVLMLSLFPGVAAATSEAEPDQAEAVPESLKGSLVKRHGKLLHVINRDAIEASGKTCLAYLLFDLPMSSDGNQRPRSGSSDQSAAKVSLRGLDATRTLLLVDGRPAAISPFSGSESNLGTIPLAAVEQVEILANATAATYGSGAAAAVVNIVLRKSYSGMQVSYSTGKPSIRGGDIEAAASVMGFSGDRGSIVASVSRDSRAIAFARDQIGGDELGVTSFGNNYRLANSPIAPIGGLRAIPGFDCSGSGTGAAGPADVFYQSASGLCSYNFNAVAANTASSATNGLHVAGEFEISPNWTAHLQTTVSRQSSFGQYAPTPAEVFVPEGSPNDPVPGDGRGALVQHRFGGVGPRKSTFDENAQDVRLAVSGRMSDRWQLTAGIRQADHQGQDLGRNYIVTRLAELAIQDGRYNLRDPFGAPQSVLDSFSAVINRDARWKQREAHVGSNFDLFQTSAGTSTLEAELSWLDQDYFDQYDALQSAGQISGSSGNSARGTRTQASLETRWFLPVHESFDVTLAGRLDHDHDFGSEPTASLLLQWRPWRALEIHGAIGSGYTLPSLDALNQEPSPFALSVVDRRTCLALGRTDCFQNPQVQVNAVRLANPFLEPEQNQQISAGVAYEFESGWSAGVDYYRIKVSDRLVAILPQGLIDRDNFGGFIPAGLSVVRDPQTGALLRVESGYTNTGSLDTDGVDLRVGFRTDTDHFGHWESTLQASHLLHQRIGSEFSAGEAYEFDIAGDFGMPEQRAEWTTHWTQGDWRVSARTIGIGKQDREEETLIGTYVTHDLQIAWTFSPGSTLAIGATNLADRFPSLDSGGSTMPWNDYLYNAWGRTPYVQATFKF